VTGAVERRDLDGSDFLLKEDKQGKRSDDKDGLVNGESATGTGLPEPVTTTNARSPGVVDCGKAARVVVSQDSKEILQSDLSQSVF